MTDVSPEADPGTGPDEHSHGAPGQGETTGEFAAVDRELLRLHYSAISDVGRVRKDNQDSGYAGPWLLTVCDGVGGAARGDIASSTAVSELRTIDVPPASALGDGTSGPSGTVVAQPAILDRVTDALHLAHEQIGRAVDEDPSINGTSTTATVALFDGRRVGIGHVGDTRAYLFRENEISQLTTDHTFVQSLIDEGRITEEEARVHPHRNLILKALDGIHEAEPDLFVLELVAGDRLLICSDGCCGVLDDGRLADILSMGSPDYAAVELVRASLEAGSSDNVTCVVADVVTASAAAQDPSYAELEPMLVGAAAELKRRAPKGLFRGHRSGDTGELEPIREEIADGPAHPTPPASVDPEAARYAPMPPPRYRWLRRLMAAIVVVGLLWIAAAAGWSFVQRQYYIGEEDGVVVIYRGVDASLPGLDLSEVVVVTTLRLDELAENERGIVLDHMGADSLADARQQVEELAARRMADAGAEG